MKIFFSLVFIFSCVNSIHAFQLNNVKTSDLQGYDECRLMDYVHQNGQLSDIEIIKPIAERVLKKSAVKTEHVNLSMQIRRFNDANETEANDFFARIEVIIKKFSGDNYSVRTTAGSDYAWGNIRKRTADEYYLRGDGINLTMDKWNKNYTIHGNIYDGQQHKSIDIVLRDRFDDDNFAYHVSDFQLSLTVNERGINGYFNTDNYSKKAVAAIVSFILVLHDQKFSAKTPPV